MTDYHQPYDRISKDLLQNIKVPLVRFLTGMEPKEVIPLNIEFQQIQSKAADLLFIARFEECEKLFHIEIQTDNHPQMLYRMLGYFNEILRQYGMLPHQSVLYFGRHKLNMRNRITDGEKLNYEYELIDVSKLEPASWLNLKEVNLLPFLPLMKGKGEEYLKWCLQVIIKELSRLDSRSRDDLLFKTKVLSGLRYKQLVLQENFKEVQGMFSLKDNPVIKEIWEEGKLEGKLEGEIKGKLEGEIKGEIKGKLEGEIKGKLEGLRQSLILTLEVRFGALSQKHLQKVKTLENSNVLEFLIKQAVSVKSLKEFQAILNSSC